MILLHGAGGDGASMARGTAFDAIAQQHGFLAVYPDGADRFWNAGFCCPRPTPVVADDVGFLSALMDTLDRRYHVDPARTYAAGFSNGGYMAYRLACELSGRLAAVAAVGADSQECIGTPRPVSVIQVQGSADDRNTGSEQGLRGGAWVVVGPSAPGQWATLDGCPPSPQVSVSGVERTSRWRPCVGGTEVELVFIQGGGHTWPRASPDTSQLIGAFFNAHRRA